MSAFELAGTRAGAGDAGAGGRIRAVRGTQSQREFAAALRVHPNTLGRIERGERIPDLLLLRDLCRQFGVNARWLLLGEGRMRVSVYDVSTLGIAGLRDSGAHSVPDGAEIDEGLFGTILAAIERVHADRAIQVPAEDRGRLAAQIYLDVSAATEDPAARRAMVPAIAASLARFLSTRDARGAGADKK